MSPADLQRVAAAVRAAEAGTSAELVCVMARASSNYEFFPLVWAALLALAAPWFMIEFTLWSVERIFVVQLVLFIAILLILSISPLRMALVPQGLKRQRAHRAAAEQFLLRGLSRKRDRTGVLIFVSQAEHYARIIADEGVARKIEPKQWQAAIDILVEHARDDRMADGFVGAIELCGKLLAENFPPSPQAVNELSDRFYVM
jgi:putative membrane protein